MKKYQFEIGDLVKNKKNATHRDQTALGIVMENSIVYGCQVIKVKWIKSKTLDMTKNLWQTYYDTSLELVASVKK